MRRKRSGMASTMIRSSSRVAGFDSLFAPRCAGASDAHRPHLDQLLLNGGVHDRPKCGVGLGLRPTRNTLKLDVVPIAYVCPSDVDHQATAQVRGDVQAERALVVKDGAGPQRLAPHAPLDESTLDVLIEGLGLGFGGRFLLSLGRWSLLAGLHDAPLIGQPGLRITFGAEGGGSHVPGQVGAVFVGLGSASTVIVGLFRSPCGTILACCCGGRVQHLCRRGTSCVHFCASMGSLKRPRFRLSEAYVTLSVVDDRSKIRTCDTRFRKLPPQARTACVLLARPPH